MEVIGVLASIATLTEVAKVAIELQRVLQEAPSRIESSVRHVHLLGVQLQALLELRSSIEGNNHISGCFAVMLEECYHRIAKVRNGLALATKRVHGRRIHWTLLGQARARELMCELNNVENSLNVVLSMMHG